MCAASRPLLRPLRIGVIGARRVRQGTGPYLARFFAAEGATVVGVVGTSSRTAEEAAEALRAAGIGARPYVDAKALVEGEALDALVIASPATTHGSYLELAARSDLHVLCEKPLCWGRPDPAGHARRLAGAFIAEGLHLMLQTQWPETLGTYDRLFPGVRSSPWRRFEMELAPARPGPGMVPDAVPHALSVLYAALPDADARVLEPRIHLNGEAADVRFAYEAGGRRAEAELRLRPQDAVPRPAAYGFDGHVAHRQVDPEDYGMTLRGDGRTLPLADPTPRIVRRFVSRVRSGEPARVDPGAVPGMAHLAAIARAWPRPPR